MADRIEGALTQANAPRWEKRVRETISGPDTGALTAMQKRLESGASSTREALQKAREDIMARKRSKSGKWFDLAQAFTAPNVYGGMGETIGRVAGAMGRDVTGQQEFETQRQADLAGIDKELRGAEQGLTKSEIDLMKLRKRTRDVSQLEGSYAPKKGVNGDEVEKMPEPSKFTTAQEFQEMLASDDFKTGVGMFDALWGKLAAQWGDESALLGQQAKQMARKMAIDSIGELKPVSDRDLKLVMEGAPDEFDNYHTWNKWFRDSYKPAMERIMRDEGVEMSFDEYFGTKGKVGARKEGIAARQTAAAPVRSGRSQLPETAASETLGGLSDEELDRMILEAQQ